MMTCRTQEMAKTRIGIRKCSLCVRMTTSKTRADKATSREGISIIRFYLSPPVVHTSVKRNAVRLSAGRGIPHKPLGLWLMLFLERLQGVVHTKGTKDGNQQKESRLYCVM